MRSSSAQRVLRADLLLLMAALIWGTAFVAQRLGTQAVGPLAFNGFRFLMGAIVLIPLLRGRGSLFRRDTLARGFLAGALLFTAALLQQWGILSTTAGKAGFFTSLYVVIVPILTMATGRFPSIIEWAGASLALVGTYLLGMQEDGTINFGDVLVSLGAVVWALHFMVIEKFTLVEDTIKLAFLQIIVCSLLCLIGAAMFETVTLDAMRSSLGPMLYAGILSVGVGYTVQVVAQKDAPATHAAILLSLEAVFAAVSGILWLGETMSTKAWMGCGLMLLGAIVCQLRPTQKPGLSPAD